MFSRTISKDFCCLPNRYEFVKQLKKSIEEILGGFIDEEIEKCGMDVAEEVGHEETQVDRITERVIHSSPYVDHLFACGRASL